MSSPESDSLSPEQVPIDPRNFHLSRELVLKILESPEEKAGKFLVDLGDFIYTPASLDITNGFSGVPIWASLKGHTVPYKNKEQILHTLIDIEFPGFLASGVARVRGKDPECKVVVGHYPLNYDPFNRFLADHAEN